MNYRGIYSIYKFEMRRTFRTPIQSIVSPIVSTVLYFIVFGLAMGNYFTSIDGVPYGSFIVPGLIMMTILGQGISNASFGIYFPRFTGTIYEILSAPISSIEIVIAYVGAAATKSFIIGNIILITANFFVPIQIIHPFGMELFLIMICITFSLLGFIIGIWADGFEQLSIIPMLVITPLSFLGGSFYSIQMLPIFWQKISLINPMVYLISGFRWTFYGSSSISIKTSIIITLIFISISITLIRWIFKTGYRLKN
jgi:ABC-2 type transport system permease protein